jgi:hypothetical protein
MTKQELHDFAAAGVANRIRDIERELADYHKEWPTLFVTPTPPQLLAAAKKAATSNGNGASAWPATSATPLPGLSGKIVTFLGTTERATFTMIRDGIGASDSGVNRALNKLVESGRVQKAERGLYTLGTGAFERGYAIGAGTPPPKKQKRPMKWTPAMRKAAAVRMRAMHKDGRIARGLAKAKRAKTE